MSATSNWEDCKCPKVDKFTYSVFDRPDQQDRQRSAVVKHGFHAHTSARSFGDDFWKVASETFSRRQVEGQICTLSSLAYNLIPCRCLVTMVLPLKHALKVLFSPAVLSSLTLDCVRRPTDATCGLSLPQLCNHQPSFETFCRCYLAAQAAT